MSALVGKYGRFNIDHPISGDPFEIVDTNASFVALRFLEGGKSDPIRVISAQNFIEHDPEITDDHPHQLSKGRLVAAVNRGRRIDDAQNSQADEDG